MTILTINRADQMPVMNATTVPARIGDKGKPHAAEPISKTSLNLSAHAARVAGTAE